MNYTANNLNYTNTDLKIESAIQNFKNHLLENIYPGRGIVVGRNKENSWIVVYWIMGRSSNSRNRILCHENGILFTKVVDPSRVQDPSLIIYNALRDVDDCVVVTNGSQTDKICEGLKHKESFYCTILKEKHEMDAPNFTSRISGLIDQKKSSMTLAIVSKCDFSAKQSVYHFHSYTEIRAGFGYCLTTYMGDGNPLPPFKGDPILLPLEGNAEQIANLYWNALNHDNRISLAVRELSDSGKDILKIINCFDSKDGGKN